MTTNSRLALPLTIAVVMNSILLALCSWLTFNPPVLWRTPPTPNLGYMILAAYPLVNLVALVFLHNKRGVLRVLKNIVLSVNVLLIPLEVAVVVWLVSDGTTGSPVFYILLLLITPPSITAAGLWYSK